jgi:hypothetical protein
MERQKFLIKTFISYAESVRTSCDHKKTRTTRENAASVNAASAEKKIGESCDHKKRKRQEKTQRTRTQQTLRTEL